MLNNSEAVWSLKRAAPHVAPRVRGGNGGQGDQQVNQTLLLFLPLCPAMRGCKHTGLADASLVLTRFCLRASRYISRKAPEHCAYFDTYLSTHHTLSNINLPVAHQRSNICLGETLNKPHGFLCFLFFEFCRRRRKTKENKKKLTSAHSPTQICVRLHGYLPIHTIQIFRIKCSKQRSNRKHENTSDLFWLPCLLVHGTLHANRMQMHLIESGDAEVIVFGEMSKTVFFSVFFLYSSLSVGGFPL